MTFTYDPGAWPTDAAGFPLRPDLAVVREMLGDIDQRAAFYQDEQINAVLGEVGVGAAGGTGASDRLLLTAAVRLAEDAVAQLSRLSDENGAGITVSRAQRFTQWEDTLRYLRHRLSLHSRPRYVGGSKSAIEAARRDTDYRQPLIQVGAGRRLDVAYPRTTTALPGD